MGTRTRQRVETAQGGGVTLRLTPELIAAAYEYLRASQPFCRWALPPATDLKLKVTRSTKRRATFLYVPGTTDGCEIHVSERHAGQTITLLALVAHEMIHLKQRRSGARGDVEHNAEFRRLFNRVCRIHGFDPLWFL